MTEKLAVCSLPNLLTHTAVHPGKGKLSGALPRSTSVTCNYCVMVHMSIFTPTCISLNKSLICIFLLGSHVKIVRRVKFCEILQLWALYLAAAKAERLIL